MTSLEYIRNKISKKIKTINEKRNFMTNCKQMGIPFNSKLTYEDEKELEYLRQVECELEAWEVVRIETLITDGGVIHMTIEDDDVGYETVIKALEVEDE